VIKIAVSDGLQEPIFLFSLPRSGSTLTQRLLSTHEEIATASEPWILLPYLYTLRDRGVYADYIHKSAVRAIRDFCRLMPEGEEGYLSELRNFVLQLYAKASGGTTRYFLDKTPSYSLIAEEILRLFPEGKFILLWRNPLAVVASMLETPWGPGAGEWNLYNRELQLFEGLESLVNVSQRHRAMVHVVRYEDILANPYEELSRIFEYLGLAYNASSLDRFKFVKLEGDFKDQFGIELYDRVSTEPLEKWKRTLTNPIRKAWCRSYLRWIGAERLALMGYDFDVLLADLHSVPTSLQWLVSDARHVGYGMARNLYRAWIFKDEDYIFPGWVRDRVRESALPGWLQTYTTKGSTSKVLGPTEGAPK
jgi:hypothetical protein